MWRPKIPPCPRTGVAEGNTFPCPRQMVSALLEITPLTAACLPVPAIRALNLVGRFFLLLVPIETFLQAPIWDRAQREPERLTLPLAPGCVEGQGGECESHQEKAPAAAQGGGALGTAHGARCPQEKVLRPPHQPCRSSSPCFLPPPTLPPVQCHRNWEESSLT